MPLPPESNLPAAVVHPAWAGEPGDGGSYRKRGLTSYLAGLAGANFQEVVLSCGSSRLTRGARSLVDLADFALRTRARAVLFFYPALPLFHPASGFKLPALAVWLAVVRCTLRGRGVRIVLDVEDLPEPQHRELFDVPHSAGLATISTAERWLGRFADEVWIPSVSLGDRWREATERPGQPLRIVPTGAERQAAPAPNRRRPGIRFLYAGTLAREQERGVERLLRDFQAAAARATPPAKLVLAGPGGDWLRKRALGDRVELAGALEAEQAEALAAGCDWGLVPYPERGYFHDVFPAKLSFYTACGLPVLTTNLRETAAAVRRHGVGRVASEGDWARVLAELASSPPPPRVACPWLWADLLGEVVPPRESAPERDPQDPGNRIGACVPNRRHV
ncbi:MAG: glycosyltransferase [Candidatus Wallbacteria bacterium]|nr:glycosyltransferase [Candidatus Wallbacteria bacterium]